jgi:alpha-1,2-mannosyltransferase
VNSDASEAPAAGERLLRAGRIAFAAVLASWLLFTVLNRALSMIDLTVYRDGGLIVRQVSPYYSPGAWAPLYDWGGFSPLALKFTYTPFAAMMFAVASFLPWLVMAAGSVIGNMAALVAALWFTFGGLGYRDRRVRLGATLLAAAVTFWLQPVVRTIYLGQVNLVLMAMIIGDLCQPSARADGRPRWWKGALTGVAAGIKLVPLVFVPYLLITRRFREAAATLAGFVITVAAGFALLPHDSSQWWLHGMFLADGNRAGFMGWAGNQSLRAVITRFAGSVAAGQDPWIVAAVVALTAGMTAAYLLDRAGYPVPALLATALTGLLLSPVSWDHHWVWVAPAVAVTGHYALTSSRAGRQRAARALWSLAAFMLAAFAAWPDALWASASNLGNFSLGLLWVQPNTNPELFAQHGDQPGYVEYHWHGLQLLWGNAYILAGVILLAVALVTAIRLRKAPAAGDAGTAGQGAEPAAEPAPDPLTAPRLASS